MWLEANLEGTKVSLERDGENYRDRYSSSGGGSRARLKLAKRWFSGFTLSLEVLANEGPESAEGPGDWQLGFIILSGAR